MATRMTYSHLINESLVHIIQPVGTQVVKSILDRMGYLDFFGNDITISTDFSGSTTAVDAEGNAKISRNRVRVKLNPSVNPSNNKWEGAGTTHDLGNGNMLITNPGARSTTRVPWKLDAFAPKNFALFSDSEAFVDLYEMSVGSTLSMEVTCDFQYMINASDFLGRIFQCFQNGDMIGYADVQYDYPIPMRTQRIMRYLYGLRGKRSDKDTCYDWVHDLSKGNISIMVNRNDPRKREVIVSRNNFRALYLIECTQDFPTCTEPASGSAVTFNITVQYARANRLILQYPIIINNQFVDFDYIPMKEEFRIGEPSPMMWDNYAVTRYWQELYVKKGPLAIHYPWWDNWDLPQQCLMARRGMRPVCIVAFTLDDIQNENGETVIDLVDGLPGFKLNDEIIREIKYKRNTLLFPNDYVGIGVFADDVAVGNTSWHYGYGSLLDISDGRHLHIKSRRSTSIYHLVIAVNPNPINLTSRPIDYQVRPSRWIDITKPTYVHTKDETVLANTKYFYWDDFNKKHVEIPASELVVGRNTFELKTKYGVNVLFTQDPPISETSMAPQYQDIPTASEATTKIDESIIGEESSPVYCYRTTVPPNSTLFASSATTDETVSYTYIDLEAVCAQIRVKYPSVTVITLSMIRTELNIPATTPITLETAPAITEPIDSYVARSESYIKSSRGRNVSNVWKAGITVKRFGWQKNTVSMKVS